jgi:hypothetical protein
MTLGQWWAHIRQWLFMLIAFPMPNNDTHMWVGLVGEREQHCLICGAVGLDDISDEQLQRDREMNEEYSRLHEKFFGKDEDVEVDNRS